jgi:hypothetical protein
VILAGKKITKKKKIYKIELKKTLNIKRKNKKNNKITKKYN